MFSIHGSGTQLCDGLTRREMLRVGGISALGLNLPHLLAPRSALAGPATSGQGTAKSCIVLFLMGGPPQHSTWDPKPGAPAEVRGEFGPISTIVPGISVCELLPRTALLADRLCLIRSVSSNDNAHSSSGYYMLTGVPHAPMNSENANPGPPNDYPSLGGIVRRLESGATGLPPSVTLPHRIFNTDGSVWPGQDAGFLGRATDPWLLNAKPADADFRINELSLNADVSAGRMSERQSLLERVNSRLDEIDRSGRPRHYQRLTEQAFNLLNSTKSRQAFRLDGEPDSVRDRYGRTQFGQSTLLARRLIEAGVKLVQVNWYRGPEEPSDAPCWDSHARESQRLKTVLVPPADMAISALLEDLEARGMLDETLVVCMAEFGRTPRFNGAAGRDHWGHVYSVALAGGGIRGGMVYGASDPIGAYPKEARVAPQDLTATIFHCLGYDPHTEIRDTLDRPLPISRGEVIRPILA
ncbi:MAG: DUF1501 domain-containing protein [Planctomycetes bacterium]|nr:DUF1501 domain-containing protein [Planctomycetota bacterium]